MGSSLPTRTWGVLKKFWNQPLFRGGTFSLATLIGVLLLIWDGAEIIQAIAGASGKIYQLAATPAFGWIIFGAVLLMLGMGIRKAIDAEDASAEALRERVSEETAVRQEAVAAVRSELVPALRLCTLFGEQYLQIQQQARSGSIVANMDRHLGELEAGIRSMERGDSGEWGPMERLKLEQSVRAVAESVDQLLGLLGEPPRHDKLIFPAAGDAFVKGHWENHVNLTEEAQKVHKLVAAKERRSHEVAREMRQLSEQLNALQ